MIKNILFTIILFIVFGWLMANISYGGDYSVTVTERTKDKSITCMTRKIADNHRVLICSEKAFILGDILLPNVGGDKPEGVVLITPPKANTGSNPIVKKPISKPTVSKPNTFIPVDRGGRSIPGGLGQ